MKVFLIGLGQAGCKITDLFIKDDLSWRGEKIYKAIAVNSARPDLVGLKYIPQQSRILIGETIVRGHGVGANNKLGAKIARQEIDKILSAIDMSGTSDTDAFLIVTALGGGTGSGGAPVVAKHLKRLYNEPVYVIGVLPADSEGNVYILNAARSLKTISKYSDAMILVDNNAFLKPGESLRSAYTWINSEIVKRFGLIARAGEIGMSGEVGELIVDASEVANTLKGMEICTLGYASEALPTSSVLKKAILGADKPDQRKSARITSLVMRAAKSRLLLPCDFTTARKSLVVVAGPPDELSRDGVERSREWLEKNLAPGSEVRGGDYPVRNSRYVAVGVVLAGLTGVSRIDHLFERARQMQEALAKGLSPEEAKRIERTSQLMQFIEDLESEEVSGEEIEDLLKDLEV